MRSCPRRDPSAAIAVTLAFAITSACGSDVIVGLNPRADDGANGDATTVDAALDAASEDASDGASADGSASPIDRGALAALSLDAAGYVLGGFAGGATGAEPASDLWTLSLSPTGSALAQSRLDVEGAADAIVAAIAYGDGGYVLAGYATSVGRRGAWLRRVRGDGSEAWTAKLDDGAAPMQAEALALGAGGTVVGAGTEGNPSEGWVARFSADGALVWRTDLGPTGAKGTPLHAVTLGQFDRVYAGGERSVATDAGLVTTPTVLQLSADGSLFNSSVTRFPVGTAGAVRGMRADGVGNVVLCADTTGGPTVARIDELFTTTSAIYTYPSATTVRLAACAATTDGALALAGTDEGAPAPRPWIAKHDLAAFTTPRWVRTPTVPRGARADAVAAGPGGAVLAAGRLEGPAEAWWTLEAP